MTVTTWAKTLFAAKPARPARRPAPTRKARLGVEQFGERVMPSMTVVSSDGVLRITADDAGSTAVVTSTSSSTLKSGNTVSVSDGTRAVYTGSSAGLRAVVFQGGRGNDTFVNQSYLPTSASGGAGDDTLTANPNSRASNGLFGGDGNDTLTGGAGDDLMMGEGGNDALAASAGADNYSGGAGNDALDRRGFHGMFNDGTTSDATYDSVSGKTAGRFTPGELKAVGQLNVRLDGTGRLWLTGPSGAGFALRSNWQAATVRGNLSFTTTSAVTVQTEWGDVTLPAAGAAFRVSTAATGVPGVGSAPAFSLGSVPLSSNAAVNDSAALKFMGGLAEALSGKLNSTTGATLSLPGASWGVGLGRPAGDTTAPLNPAVPYIFGHAQAGMSVGYDNVSYGNAVSGTVAFAPGDGTIYASLTGMPVLSDIAVGVSTTGYLPFAPKNVPAGTVDPEIYGNYYVRGELEIPGVPLAVSGEFCLDLDANNDGTLLSDDSQLTRDMVDLAVRKMGRSVIDPAMTQAAMAAVQDMAFGLNTGLAFGYEGLSLNLAESTYWRTPTELAFRGKSSNPFQGIPYLENIQTAGGYDVQGWVKADQTWGLSLYAGAGTIPGLPQASITVTGGSAAAGFTVTGQAILTDLPYVGRTGVTLSGTIGFDGDYNLSASFSLGNWGTATVHTAQTGGRRRSWMDGNVDFRALDAAIRREVESLGRTIEDGIRNVIRI